MTHLQSTWAKLRRRKVAQWGLAYSAAAWTLLQVLQYLTETYTWPPAVRQIATPTFALGLLFVLVLAWYHGDKGEQRVSRPEAAILLTMLALVSGTLWWYGSSLDESAWVADTGVPNIKHVVPTDAASVAVLPFVDMSEAHDQEYFADGLSEEVLNALARIPGLYVPARTSSFQFKGKSGDVARFAALLGVASVLEGSVRKSGSRIRVTAQLVNASDGYHLWSETYDRDLKDIFAIQEEISKAISDALKIRLTAKQRLSTTESPPTSNLDAYEAYLLGRFELNQRGRHIRTAIPYFEQAIALDPQFGVAYADLALAYKLSCCEPGDLPTLQVRMQDAINKAMALDPDRPEVLAAAGQAEWAVGHRERALELFNKSLAARPNSGEVLAWRRRMYTELGRFDEALAASYDSVKRDPLSWLALRNHGETLMSFGRTSEIMPVVERLRTLGRPGPANEILQLQARQTADRAEVMRLCLLWTDAVGKNACYDSETMSSLGLRDEVARIADPGEVHIYFGEFDAALPLLQAAFGRDPLLFRQQLVFTLYRVGRYAEAAQLLSEEWKEDAPSGWDETAYWLVLSANVARGAGLTKDAAEYRRRANEVLTSFDRAGVVVIGARAYARAMLHAYDGQDDQAAKWLIVAMRTEPAVWQFAKTEVLLAKILGRPEVRATIVEQDSLAARQRAEVLEMLCGPNPVSKTYQPAPATCAKRKSNS